MLEIRGNATRKPERMGISRGNPRQLDLLQLLCKGFTCPAAGDAAREGPELQVQGYGVELYAQLSVSPKT